MKLAALSLITGLLLTGCTGTAMSPAEQTSLDTPLTFSAIKTKGESLQPVTNEALTGWLVTSEHAGLIWLSPDFTEQGNWPGHISQADWRWLDNNTLIVAALDNNTTAVQLFTLDINNGNFTHQLTLPSDIADRETLCLQQDNEHIFMFSTDARGLLTHSLLLTEHANWKVSEVRSLMVGPNISACSVADDTRTLFIAEEEVGIWQYPAVPEGDNVRTLEYFASMPELESVSALRDGRYYSVATDAPLISERGDISKDWQVDSQWELKSIKVSSNSSEILAGMYDEASHTLFAGYLPGQPVKVSAEKPVTMFTADAQTAPVNRFGDAADDPAFWINEAYPEKSLILGTDKKYGLNVYALDGSLLQTLPVGRVNNVDVRQGIATSSGTVDIAVASNRSSQSLSIFTIDANGSVALLSNSPTTLSDVYGLCSGMINGALHVVVNDTDGRFQQYEIKLDDTTARTEIVSEFTLPSQPEGCAIDDASGTLYYGEESTGVWMRSLTNPTFAATRIASINDDVQADIEGMDIYIFDDQRFLIVSSQGNNRFAVYALDDNNRLLGTFGIKMNHKAGIDGVSETDGLAVTSMPLGANYPLGMMVVQDGRNVLPMSPQNFKILNGQKLAEFIRSHR